MVASDADWIGGAEQGQVVGCEELEMAPVEPDGAGRSLPDWRCGNAGCKGPTPHSAPKASVA